MKRLLCISLTILMIFLCVASSIFVARGTSEQYILGDVNDSGEIDSMDYVLVKRAYFGTFGFNELQLKSGDVNNSGDIDSMDYVLIKRAYFGTFVIQQPSNDQTGNDTSDNSSDISSNDTIDDTSVPEVNTSDESSTDQSDNTSSEDTSDTSTDTSGETSDETSDDTSDDTSDETSDDTSDDPSGDTSEDIPNEPEKVNLNVAGGKTYTTSKEPGTSYPDVYNSELTNGSYYDIYSYTNSALSGYSTKNLSIIVDLTREYSGIHTFSSNIYLDKAAGVSSQITVTISVSNDKTEWRSVGSLTLKEEARVGTVNLAELVLDESVSARYVQFTYSGNSTWIFIEELSVIALTEPEERVDYIKEVEKAYESLGTKTTVANGADVNTNLQKICISSGVSYTTSREPNPKYPDTNKMLTDELYGSLFENGCWVGYDGGAPLKIKLDLGSMVNDIASIEVLCFSKEFLSIVLPTAMDFAAIDENGNVTELGRVYGIPKSSDGKVNFVFSTGKTISARYIEITAHTVDSAVHFIGEVLVYAYRDDGKDGELYPEVVIESGEAKWDNPSNTYTNLISGKTCQISLNGAVSKNQFGNNTPITSPLLTDGVFSTSTDIHNGKFFKFCQGENRSVIFDLGKISSAEKFTIGFTHIKGWAVYAPTEVPIIVSQNGVDWYKIGTININGSADNELRRGELTLDKGVMARYVAFSVDTISWTGIDEIQIFGRQNTEQALPASNFTLVHVEESKEEKRKAPSEDLLGGTEHLCLLYHSYDTNSYTVEDLIPYLTYVDKDGVMQDVMFDSFLFIHDTGEMPSGATPYDGSVKSDWVWEINDIFTEGKNIYALDEVAGMAKEALNLGDDYKYKVTVSLYNSGNETTNFGDVDGDGVSENFAIFEQRMKIYKWYINEIEKRFAEANFQNIALVGYYWWDESVNKQEPLILETLNSLSDYIHSIERDFFWIPYHCASGFTDWEDFGFDVACMQPNYVFKAETSYQNLINNEALTKKYGMGVEMEICSSSLGDKVFFKKYMEYLALGAESGYMTDAVNMYYQERFIFKKAAYSNTLMARTVYESTYHYIKGDLKNVPDKLDKLTYNAEQNKIFKGIIPFETEKLREFKLSAFSDHGTVIFDEDGTFYYFPEKDYAGEVKLTFVYNEYLSWSEPCEIIINIK